MVSRNCNCGTSVLEVRGDEEGSSCVGLEGGEELCFVQAEKGVVLFAEGRRDRVGEAIDFNPIVGAA